MDNIIDYIERAEKKAGTQKELARILGITTGYIRNVKAKKSGLPDAVCIEMADYIKEDPLKVIAASNLVTEKDERRRKIFESCITKTSRAACLGLALGVSSIMTPTPSHANINMNLQQINSQSIYIMLNEF